MITADHSASASLPTRSCLRACHSPLICSHRLALKKRIALAKRVLDEGCGAHHFADRAWREPGRGQPSLQGLDEVPFGLGAPPLEVVHQGRDESEGELVLNVAVEANEPEVAIVGPVPARARTLGLDSGGS